MFRDSAISAVISLLLVAAAAEGQPPRGPQAPGHSARETVPEGLAFLVAVPEVQKELDLDPDQQELLGALRADIRGQRRSVFRHNLEGDRSDGPVQSGDARQRLEAFSQQGDELVSMVLEREQTRRLKQIQLQREGIRALAREEVAQSLKLSKSQLAEIRELVQNRASEGEQRQKGGRQLQREVLSVLTDKQQEKWDALQGEAFEFPQWLMRLDRRRLSRSPDENRSR